MQAAADTAPSAEPLLGVESIGLLQALSSVPDPRKRRGRRHSLQSILLLALTAVKAAARSYAAISDWARMADHRVRVCGRPPEASTIRRVLTALDVAALEAALACWIRGRRPPAPAAEDAAAARGPAHERRQAKAVDGNTIRGSKTTGRPPTQLLAG